jgi:hypothetical protein
MLLAKLGNGSVSFPSFILLMPDDHFLAEILFRVVDADMIDAFFPSGRGDMSLQAVRFLLPDEVATITVNAYGIR